MPGLGLYSVGLLLELPGAYVRAFLVAGVVEVGLLLAGYPMTPTGEIGQPVGIAAGVAPLVWSLGAFVWPGAGLWWRWRSGGRDPSPREREAFELALDDLVAAEPGGRTPARWFVVDEALPAAAVRGRAVMVTRGLLGLPELGGVLAHELGHANTIDGRLIEALNRLVLWGDPVGPPLPYTRIQVIRPLFRSITRLVLYLAGGGASLLVLRPAWAGYWRQREYAADLYAAQLGAGDDLARFLEHHALFFDVPVPFIWLSEAAHPPVELRLGRLAAAQDHA